MGFEKTIIDAGGSRVGLFCRCLRFIDFFGAERVESLTAIGVPKENMKDVES